MVFSYNWLQEFIKGKLPNPEKLADFLALHAFEVEGVGKEAQDTLLDVSILPQRGDCLSHFGLAREISAILDQELQGVESAHVKIQKGILKPLKISFRAPKFVPRYAAVVVEGVVLGPSPQWMQERLASLGVNSINNVVDITNYVMLELGQPLHAFDYNKIQGQKMILREARQGETIELLDDTKLQLPKGVLVAQEEKRLIDLAGIKGGKLSEISKQTKNIVFQAAVFERKKIYQTKKALGYTTQAADIYSHDIDETLCKDALSRALFLLSKFGGGKPVQSLDFYPSKRSQKTILFPAEFAQKVLGVSIPVLKTKEILQRLGFGVSGAEVRIPSWRKDIVLPEDLVEEVGRIFGYENIAPIFPQASIALPEKNREIFWQEHARDTLKELGFTEVYNYSFVAKGMQKSSSSVELENPISEEFEFLRSDLLTNLIKNVEANHRQLSQNDIKIFEIGKAFQKSSGRISEHTKLAFLYAPAKPMGKSAFYELKGVVDLLLARFGIGKIWYTEETSLYRSACIAVSKERHVGFIKEIPQAPRQIVVCEIDFDLTLQNASQEKEYEPPSKYPFALRDVAVLVPFGVKVQDVVNAMETAGGQLLKTVDLFDMYEGQELPEGKKNLAFHLVYQAQDRTLTNREVDVLHAKIVKALQEHNAWEVRS